MVSKQVLLHIALKVRFRAVLFRMVSKLKKEINNRTEGFRAVLFRMVSKQVYAKFLEIFRFRAVLFRMVSKLKK